MATSKVIKGDLVLGHNTHNDNKLMKKLLLAGKPDVYVEEDLYVRDNPSVAMKFILGLVRKVKGTLRIAHWSGEDFRGYGFARLEQTGHLDIEFCPHLRTLKGLNIGLSGTGILNLQGLPNLVDITHLTGNQPGALGKIVVSACPMLPEHQYHVEPKPTEAPERKLKYSVGQHLEVALYGEPTQWVPCVVLSTDGGTTYPYQVKFVHPDGKERSRGVAEGKLRIPQTEAEEAPTAELKYKVGQKVEINGSAFVRDGSLGEIIRVDPADASTPYKVWTHVQANGTAERVEIWLRQSDLSLIENWEPEEEYKPMAPKAKPWPFAVSLADARKANAERLVPVGSEIIRDVLPSEDFVPVRTLSTQEWSYRVEGVVHNPPAPDVQYWSRGTMPYECLFSVDREEYQCWKKDMASNGEPVTWADYTAIQLLVDPPKETYPVKWPALTQYLG